jgi:hypothetical protein
MQWRIFEEPDRTLIVADVSDDPTSPVVAARCMTRRTAETLVNALTIAPELSYTRGLAADLAQLLDEALPHLPAAQQDLARAVLNQFRHGRFAAARVPASPAPTPRRTKTPTLPNLAALPALPDGPMTDELAAQIIDQGFKSHIAFAPAYAASEALRAAIAHLMPGFTPGHEREPKTIGGLKLFIGAKAFVDPKSYFRIQSARRRR